MHYSVNRIDLVYVRPTIARRLVFNNALAHLGLELSIRFFFESANALEYLESVGNDTPDMVFLETGNGHDCLQNTRQIRERHQLDQISIVLYDSGLQSADTEAAFSGGANVYINRSRDEASFKKILRHVISIGRQFHAGNVNRQTYMLSI